MKVVFTIMCLSISIYSFAQDTLQKKLELRGYIKDLQTLTFDKNFNNLITGNLLHNRINLKYSPHSKITSAVELRNRLFWGEEVKSIPSFSSGLRNNSEAVNLSITWFETEGMVLHTAIDRLWIEYHSEDWNFRVGRQRINWGIGSTWNPNDLFNTFNFLDFDYEERPGSDAIKFQYLTGDMSHVELAVSRSRINNDNTIAALRYFVNQWNYDFQFIGGWYQEQLTVGNGWSGNIYKAGFKGELEFYAKRRELENQLNMVMETDYIFSDGWYVSAGGLFNSRGTTKLPANWAPRTLELSPRNLMPTKWNILASVAKELTKLLNINASIIFCPQTNLLLILPSLQYNLATNLDVNLVWQSFFIENQNRFEGLSHRVFLRFKWSF